MVVVVVVVVRAVSGGGDHGYGGEALSFQSRLKTSMVYILELDNKASVECQEDLKLIFQSSQPCIVRTEALYSSQQKWHSEIYSYALWAEVAVSVAKETIHGDGTVI